MSGTATRITVGEAVRDCFREFGKLRKVIQKEAKPDI
jgi:hypothetical protein